MPTTKLDRLKKLNVKIPGIYSNDIVVSGKMASDNPQENAVVLSLINHKFPERTPTVVLGGDSIPALIEILKEFLP